MKEEEFRSKITKAIARYNKYREPEAAAKLIDVRNNEIEIELRGSFCETCGFYDWIDDLRWEITDEIAKDVKIIEVSNINESEAYRVRMKIKE